MISNIPGNFIQPNSNLFISILVGKIHEPYRLSDLLSSLRSLIEVKRKRMLKILRAYLYRNAELSSFFLYKPKISCT